VSDGAHPHPGVSECVPWFPSLVSIGVYHLHQVQEIVEALLALGLTIAADVVALIRRMGEPGSRLGVAVTTYSHLHHRNTSSATGPA